MQCGREQEHIKVISILKYMEEMLFVSSFKGSVHSVGEKVLYQAEAWKQKELTGTCWHKR